MSNKFTVYWQGGSKSYLTGENIESAMLNAGYSRCYPAVDFWISGINYDYEYDRVKHQWVKKTPIHMHIQDAQKNPEFARQFICDNIETSSELFFDCEDGHQLVVSKQPHLYSFGWTLVFEIYYGEYNEGSYSGDPEEKFHYVVCSIEYEDPNNIEGVIARVMKRINTPFKESGIPSVNLTELAKKQNF